MGRVRLRGRAAGLEREWTSLQQQTSSMSEKLKGLNRLIAEELRPRLSSLREELRVVEV